MVFAMEDPAAGRGRKLGPMMRVFDEHALFAGYFCLNEHQFAPIPDPQDLTTPRLPLCPCLRPARVSACCAGALPAGWRRQAATAQGRLEAQYEATLAGIPVGKGTWTIEIGDDSVFGHRPGRHRRAVEGVFRRHRLRRLAGPRRQRRAGRRMPIPRPPPPRRSPRPSAWCWPTAGVKEFFDRAGAAGRSRPASSVTDAHAARACSIR